MTIAVCGMDGGGLSAKEDLREGWNFNELASAGLGDYFLDCIQADVRSLKIVRRHP